MSTILHRRELHVAITADEAGYERAKAPADIQAAFLVAFAEQTEAFYWAMQCRFIADELTPEQGMTVASALAILDEHLREVRPCETCEGTGTVPIRNTVQVDVGPLGKKWPMTVADEVFNEECPKCHGTKVE